MQSSLGHIQLNIDLTNLDFYKQLMAQLGWSVIVEFPEGVGYTSGNGGDLWFIRSPKSELSDFDNRGVNHIGIKANSIADVDTMVEFIREQGLEPLFETPRHRPDFAHSESDTYYQVMFKTADNILFEIVYTGPKD